jgi:hypothetical protein
VGGSQVQVVRIFFILRLTRLASQGILLNILSVYLTHIDDEYEKVKFFLDETAKGFVFLESGRILLFQLVSI